MWNILKQMVMRVKIVFVFSYKTYFKSQSKKEKQNKALSLEPSIVVQYIIR